MRIKRQNGWESDLKGIEKEDIKNWKESAERLPSPTFYYSSRLSMEVSIMEKSLLSNMVSLVKNAWVLKN